MFALELLTPSEAVGAIVGGKFFVTLQLEIAYHLAERCAGGHIGRLEPPAAFGATETVKTLLLDPYQLPAHGCLHIGAAMSRLLCLQFGKFAPNFVQPVLPAVMVCLGCITWIRMSPIQFIGVMNQLYLFQQDRDSRLPSSLRVHYRSVPVLACGKKTVIQLG